MNNQSTVPWDNRLTARLALRATTAALGVALAAVAAAAALSLLTGCASTEAGEGVASDGADQRSVSLTAESGVLAVASALNHEPYEQATSTSQNGFTVDLLNALGEKTGLAVRFGKAVNHKDEKQNITEGQPADVAAKVVAGEADLGASTLRTDESLEGVAFTDPYLTAELVVVTKMGTAHDDEASLEGAGVKVAVAGDDAAAWVAENLPHAEVVTVADDVDALIEVNSELAAAAVVDAPVYQRYVKVKEPHLQAVASTGETRTYAFVVAAGNDGLLAAVNEALAAMCADGSYDALYDQWFQGTARDEAAPARDAPDAVQDSTGA